MKKLWFVLCMIGAFEISSMAQSNPPISNPPVNNVLRWMRLDGAYDSNYFPSYNDFLGGYDVSLLPQGGEGTRTWGYIDLSTTPVGNLYCSITYNINRTNYVGTGGFQAGFTNYLNYFTSSAPEYESGILSTVYSENINSDGKTGFGSVAMTNDCIPTTDDGMVEVWVIAEIAWEDGNYTDLMIMYDFTLEGWLSNS